MRAWVISAIRSRDREFLQILGKLRGGKQKVSRGKKRPIDWHYLDWLMDQPCPHCGRSLAVEQIQIAACHVSRVNQGSGTAHKAIFNAIPGCFDCHHKSHQVGESIVGGRRQWDTWADEYLSFYVAETLCEKLGSDWDEPLRLLLTGEHPDFTMTESEI